MCTLVRPSSFFRTFLVVANLSAVLTLHAQTPSYGSKPLSAMSDKDAYRKALADYSAGRFEDALAAIKHAISKKKKPEYEKQQFEILSALADREAAQGEQACARMDIKTCEQQIAKARAFADTPKVKRLEQ